MSNKSNGSALERAFAKGLHNKYKHSWIHIIADNANGQPFDVIRIYHGTPYAYDCKLCTGNVFKYERIEENQHLAFKKFAYAGGLCRIAVCFMCDPNVVYCIDYNKIKNNIKYEEAKEIASDNIQLNTN